MVYLCDWPKCLERDCDEQCNQALPPERQTTMLTNRDYLTRIASLPTAGGVCAAPRLVPTMPRAGPQAGPQGTITATGQVSTPPFRQTPRQAAIARALDHAETYLLQPAAPTRQMRTITDAFLGTPSGKALLRRTACTAGTHAKGKK